MKEELNTRHSEKRVTTADPKLLVNMFTANRVLKTWVEDFVDEDTGDVVTIERNEVIFDRGTLLDKEKVAQLQFYIQAGEIEKVEVSNQKRMAYHVERKYIRPHFAVVEVGDKKQRILFWAPDIERSIPLLKDYVELKFSGAFFILSIKEFETSIILIDNLKKQASETESQPEDETESDDNKKFYQIEFNAEDIDGSSSTYTAVVQTYNVDRAMMLINDWLNKNERRRYEEAKERGHEYVIREFRTTIESAKPIPVGIYIPKEFSNAYLIDAQ